MNTGDDTGAGTLDSVDNPSTAVRVNLAGGGSSMHALFLELKTAIEATSVHDGITVISDNTSAGSGFQYLILHNAEIISCNISDFEIYNEWYKPTVIQNYCNGLQVVEFNGHNYLDMSISGATIGSQKFAHQLKTSTTFMVMNLLNPND